MRPATAALALAFLMVAVAFAAAAAPARAADITGMYGGNLRMAVLAAPQWDPLSADATQQSMNALVWDTLARPEASRGEPEPWAAESWSYDAGTSSILVTPRAGLAWSTGTAITLADLQYTFSQYGFTVSVSAGHLVFAFPSGGAGRFFSEALYDPIAWNSAHVKMYSGLFYPNAANSSALLANTYYWAGRPYLDAVSLIPTTVDGAACRLLKSHNATFPWGIDFVGFPLAPTDLTDERTCSRYGGFTDGLGNPVNKSLSNPDPAKSEPFVSSVHHPGPRFLYYWMDSAGTVVPDASLRQALYLFVNKLTPAAIEPFSTPTNSLVNRLSWWFYSGPCPGADSCEVVRDAGFTTIRDPGGTPRQDTNPFPGAQALDLAGYLDRNGDGWRETPTGAPFALRIGSVAFNVDPRKTTMAGAYVDVIQRQGVNATLVVFSSWADLRTAEASHAVDMALETADTATTNPRFLETFAPLLAANDPNVTLHLALGRDATSLEARQLHYNHVTYYNALSAIVLPVLHYETLEAFDRDAFEGWVDAFGGVNNPWSFANVKLPQLGPLSIDLSAFSRTVTSGGQTTVQVVVTDANGAPVPGADVGLTLSAGSATTTGVTDANGRFSTVWTAPSVTESLDVTVTAEVTKAQYAGGTDAMTLTVHPAFRPLFVAVTVQANQLGAGNQTTVTVAVSSSGGGSGGGANVTLSVSLPGATLGAYSGTTDASGSFSTTFRASPSVRSIYRIDVSVSKAGYTPGEGTASVIVTPTPIQPSDYKTVDIVQNVPGFEALFVVAAIGAAVALLRLRRRREG